MHRVQDYVIWHLAKIWFDDGHKILFLFGVQKFVPADICIVHVDLSVVPDEYLEFASRFPVAINGKENLVEILSSRTIGIKGRLL